MIKIQVELDSVDFDKIFDTYFDKAQELFVDSTDPATNLMARMPKSIALGVWNSLSQHQKEKIVADILENKLKGKSDEIERTLSNNNVDLKVSKVKVTAE